jgi:hypothetical protein
MNDSFAIRVRSAAIAAWWTILVGFVFIALVWLAYLRIMSIRPDWVLRLWGPDVTWNDLEHILLSVIVAFRFFLWVLILGAIWLTLWSRRLRKTPGDVRPIA